MGAENLEGLKKCPQCAELVRSEAIICRHCKTDLVEMETKSVKTLGFANAIIKQHQKKGWAYVGESQNMIAGSSLGKVLNFKRPKKAGFFSRLLGRK